MEENKPNTSAGKDLSPEQLAGISGGDGTSCPTTVTVGANPQIQTQAPSPTDALISIYEGFVDLTSHVIERVVGLKQ